MFLSGSLVLPARRLLVALAYCGFFAVAAIGLALDSPWLGLRLAPQGDGVVVRSSAGPSAQVPAGAQLVAIRAGGTTLDLAAGDLQEEPDVADTYEQMDAFFDRQSQLAAVIAAPAVTLEWREQADAPLRETTVRPDTRPMSSLPMAFWFQLLVSSAGCLIAAWVWSLRPGEWGVRMFAITGASFPAFAMPAAVYSARELAIDGGLFRTLSALNHWGSFMFGAALVSIFLCSPRRLVPLRWVGVVFAVYTLWWLADTFRWAPDLDWGNRFAVMSEMALALALAGVHWVRSRGEPADRAALRWFLVSLLAGSGLFILSIVMTVSLGWLPPIPQGYAFGFFLFIYIGIALGLGRYRLFDLDMWSYRLLLWLGGALAVLGLDALFIALLDWTSAQALAASLWACTLAYLPIRHWLFRRFSQGPGQDIGELLPEVVRIAFQQAPTAREKLWDELLMRLFQPLEQTVRHADPGPGARLREDGLALVIPACAGMAPRTLRYPARGARLFTPRDRDFVDAVVQLMGQAEASRAAQEGATLAERQRISRDMHDDVGARLLMLIHHANTPAMAELARAAMQDLRTALSALDATPAPMAHALADWRAEASDRCDAAGVALHWTANELEADHFLPPRLKAIVERSLRECITNALKHGQPATLWVRAAMKAGALEIALEHDGPPARPQGWREGRGLHGLRHRLHSAGGFIEVAARDGGGTQARIHVPLEAEVAA